MIHKKPNNTKRKIKLKKGDMVFHQAPSCSSSVHHKMLAIIRLHGVRYSDKLSWIFLTSIFP